MVSCKFALYNADDKAINVGYLILQTFSKTLCLYVHINMYKRLLTVWNTKGQQEHTLTCHFLMYACPRSSHQEIRLALLLPPPVS